MDTGDDNRLVITSTPNQDVPYAAQPGVVPILGLDVWEHGYYLKYQNRRPEYIEVREATLAGRCGDGRSWSGGLVGEQRIHMHAD